MGSLAVYADDTEFKQWIAPPECIVEETADDGSTTTRILTYEECYPEPEEPEEPIEPVTPTDPVAPSSPRQPVRRGPLSASEFSWLYLLVPSPLAYGQYGPGALAADGRLLIIDSAESDLDLFDALNAFVTLLLLILMTAFVVFLYRRSTASLSKEDIFDKMYARVSSFWSRK
jgi:hypothetical protein